MSNNASCSVGYSEWRWVQGFLAGPFSSHCENPNARNAVLQRNHCAATGYADWRRTLRKMLAIIVLTVGVVSGTAIAQDQSTGEEIAALRRENATLRERVEKLETALSEIQGMLVQQPAATVEEDKPAVRSSYPVVLYGFVKFDAAYDSARTDVGNFARWVESEQGREDDDQFNATARESRLGLKFDGPDLADVITSGRVEVDFYEGGAENKNRLMMRHAYVQLDWPEHDFGLLAGQTSDVISPLYPQTLNYPVAWWAGNIGYRRPQLRLTKGFGVGEDSRMLLQAAATRTIGHDGLFDPGDTGEDAGFPGFQGRAALSFPMLTGRKTTLGVSGHFAQEEYDFDSRDHSTDLESWSANLDLTLPIYDWLTFKGELWTGQNLDAYLGGIGQGINLVRMKEIESTGGWMALSFEPHGRWHYNAGISIDDPEDDDLDAGDRSRNSAVWGNVIYDVNQAVQAGLELSYWETDYKHLEDGESIRLQTSLIYRF